MKKIVALLLLAAMLSVLLCSCAVDMEDVGAIIPMYLATPQTDLDPTEMVYDKDFVKVSGLVFEGLTEVTSDGKINLALAKDWEQKYDEDRGEYFLNVNLVSTKWNDGRTFTADHVIYAWKRVLSPEVASPAAALLYDIKNAKNVKAGLMTIDDLGVAAVDADTIEIQLEKPIDPELFLEAISSPSLVSLRDDVVVGKEDVWSTDVNDIATNGKFNVKSMKADGKYSLEFSKFYRLSTEAEDGYNVYVKPYQLISDYSKNFDDAITAFNNGEIYYVGAFNKDTYAANEKKIESSDSLSSYTYYFDCENEVLKDAKVRKALSTALDREEIASIIGLGTKASVGFVTEAASGTSMKKNFRDTAKDVYATKANAEDAKNLLKEAKVSGGTFAITFRNDRAYDEEVAEYAKKTWEALGFKVSLNGLDAEAYEKALYEGNFDVIALDYQALSTNAYAALAPFAPSYSGSVVSVDAESSGIAPHVTGYVSEEYEKILDEVLAETEREERVKKLVELEKILAEDCPAISLVEYSHNYLASSQLKGLETSPYGYTVFTNAT
ncbi:MAG: hypothetical protein IKU24_02595 [Clostridia bacterium]|nr:hypothetical protein [Clostridia bacterium]